MPKQPGLFAYCYRLFVFILKMKAYSNDVLDLQDFLNSTFSFPCALVFLGLFVSFWGRLCHNLPVAVLTFLFSAMALG